MRCVSRITKALHSENPDLIRGFDVLIEMQKIFLKNPPENSEKICLVFKNLIKYTEDLKMSVIN